MASGRRVGGGRESGTGEEVVESCGCTMPNLSCTQSLESVGLEIRLPRSSPVLRMRGGPTALQPHPLLTTSLGNREAVHVGALGS